MAGWASGVMGGRGLRRGCVRRPRTGQSRGSRRIHRAAQLAVGPGLPYCEGEQAGTLPQWRAGRVRPQVEAQHRLNEAGGGQFEFLQHAGEPEPVDQAEGEGHTHTVPAETAARGCPGRQSRRWRRWRGYRRNGRGRQADDLERGKHQGDRMRRGGRPSPPGTPGRASHAGLRGTRGWRLGRVGAPRAGATRRGRADDRNPSRCDGLPPRRTHSTAPGPKPGETLPVCSRTRRRGGRVRGPPTQRGLPAPSAPVRGDADRGRP